MTSSRQIAPLRSSTEPGETANPLRRQENQRSTAARRGEEVKPSSRSPRPLNPTSASASASSPANSGSIKPSTRRTSSTSPTGRIVVFCWPAAPLVEEWLARLTRTSHQPNGRQSSGWLTLTEWMRPGGRVSLLVDSRPKPTRTPSGVPAIEYRSDLRNLWT